MLDQLKSCSCSFFTSCIHQLKIYRIWEKSTSSFDPKAKPATGETQRVITVYLYCAPPSRSSRHSSTLLSNRPSIHYSAQQLISPYQHKCSAMDGSLMKCGVVEKRYKTPHFHPRHWHPPSRNGATKNRVGLDKTFSPLISHFSAAACTNRVMTLSAACECGAKEQTIDHVLHCPIHQPSHGLHSLTVLDDETIKWLLNTCPEI